MNNINFNRGSDLIDTNGFIEFLKKGYKLIDVNSLVNDKIKLNCS